MQSSMKRRDRPWRTNESPSQDLAALTPQLRHTTRQEIKAVVMVVSLCDFDDERYGRSRFQGEPARLDDSARSVPTLRQPQGVPNSLLYGLMRPCWSAD